MIAGFISSYKKFPVKNAQRGNRFFAAYRPLDPYQHAGTQNGPPSWQHEMNVEQGKYYNHVGRTYLAKADMPACIWAPGNEPEVQPAVKPHHTFLRQAVPQAGAGSERSVPFSVVYEESGDISDEYQNGLRWMNYDDGTYSGTRTFTEKHGNPVTRNNFSGTLPLNAWTRTAPDLISGVLEGRRLDLPAGFDCTFDNATRHYWGETRYRKEGAETGTTDSRETMTERINEVQSKHGWGLGAFGS